jgi:hypothetical protein
MGELYGYQIDLSGTNLEKASLQGATLKEIKLQSTNLSKAQLQGADFYKAQLQFSDFRGSRMQGAYWYRAQLQGSDLRYTPLGGVDFGDADLSYACVGGADFTNTGEKTNAPTRFNIANARGIEKLLFDHPEKCRALSASPDGVAPWTDTETYTETSETRTNIAYSPYSRFDDLAPIGFYPLAKQLRDQGYIEQARRITYAYKHNEQRFLLYKISRLWDQWDFSFFLTVKYLLYAAFDFTTHWGMHPFLALRHLLGLIVFGWVVYTAYALRQTHRRLKVKVANHFVPPPPSAASAYYVTATPPPPSSEGYSLYTFKEYVALRPRTHFARTRAVCLFLFLALWISAVNSVRFGWKDIADLGTWLTQLHPRDITFETSGWMHTFLTVQSIIGKYFLASFFLTFFGAPFNTW